MCAESRLVQRKDSLRSEEAIANIPLAGYRRGKSSDVGHTTDKLPENLEGVKRVVDLVDVVENQELTEKTAPVGFAPQEFTDSTEQVNHCATHSARFLEICLRRYGKTHEGNSV